MDVSTLVIKLNYSCFFVGRPNQVLHFNGCYIVVRQEVLL